MARQKLILPISIPAGGKSTFARKLRATNIDYRISSVDAFRAMMNGIYAFSSSLDADARDGAVETLKLWLRRGRWLIFDECNINKESRAELITAAREINPMIAIYAVIILPPMFKAMENMKSNLRGYGHSYWLQVIPIIGQYLELPQIDEGFTAIYDQHEFLANADSIPGVDFGAVDRISGIPAFKTAIEKYERIRAGGASTFDSDVTEAARCASSAAHEEALSRQKPSQDQTEFPLNGAGLPMSDVERVIEDLQKGAKSDK